jgi:hypothetical protein
MSFETLLKDLDDLHTLRKSAPADDKSEADDEKIEAAAEEGEANREPDGDEDAMSAVKDDNMYEDADGEAHEGDDDDDFDGDKPFGKSFVVTDEAGKKLTAVNGTALVKSLMERLDGQEASLERALGAAVDLIKAQGAELADLQNHVKRLSTEGRGRKTVVSVAEKPAAGTMDKLEPPGMTGQEFMVKALDAQKSGRLSALQVSIAETALQKGVTVPADIVGRVLV